MIHVKQQLQPRRADPANNAGHPVQVVSLVSRMALHRVRRIPGVEVFQANRDPLFLGMLNDGPEALDAVVRALLPADFAALGIIGVAPLVTAEGDDVGETRLGTGVDRLPRPRDDFLMIARIIEAAHKGHPRHAVGGNGANQVVLFKDAPVLGRDNFHRWTSQVPRLPAGPFHVPSLPRGVEAPEHHRLPDAAIDHRPGLRSCRRGRQTRQSGRRSRNRQTTQ